MHWLGIVSTDTYVIVPERLSWPRVFGSASVASEISGMNDWMCGFVLIFKNHVITEFFMSLCRRRCNSNVELPCHYCARRLA